MRCTAAAKELAVCRGSRTWWEGREKKQRGTQELASADALTCVVQSSEICRGA